MKSFLFLTGALVSSCAKISLSEYPIVQITCPYCASILVRKTPKLLRQIDAIHRFKRVMSNTLQRILLLTLPYQKSDGHCGKIEQFFYQKNRVA
jgi:hypothetical protein